MKAVLRAVAFGFGAAAAGVAGVAALCGLAFLVLEYLGIWAYVGLAFTLLGGSLSIGHYLYNQPLQATDEAANKP